MAQGFRSTGLVVAAANLTNLVSWLQIIVKVLLQFAGMRQPFMIV